ncbi:hypothetical protein HK097_007417 [Rhizophlyctis rosea]|uniref:Amidase domain-containing protein n=1 Tax=Rhizophlyctis rosea TaxID=64517 RepID=A0AAD5SES1_9FUNG|nr:hypothetical protein HK097_007417 [Rhizophlyctis rosea]
MQITHAFSLIFCATAILGNGAVAQYVKAGTPAVSVSYSGQTVTLSGLDYYIPPAVVSKLSSSVKVSGITGDLIPFTVISTADSVFTSAAFDKIVMDYKSKDDVFSDGFLGAVYIKYTGTKKPTIATGALTAIIKKYGSKTFLTSTNYKLSSSSKFSKDLPIGPYFLSLFTGEIHQAYRLYPDEQQAFLYGTIPTSSDSFGILNAHVKGAHTATVGVPSRLYYTKTTKQPLAGVRLAVKDIYDVKGLKTGCGNRAYYDLYPEKTKTAESVKRLVDAGVVVVGKVKTSQFANGESPTADWVDLHSPFNPRGDGYQIPSSSSSGSGAAMAAYPWLDLALGSDTGGSMRGPAGSNGLFGNRPTHGVVPLDNVMPLAGALDTPGIFARDAELWKAAGHVWYKGLKDFKTYPKKVVLPNEYWGAGVRAQPVFDEFAAKLASFLKGSVVNYNMTELWDAGKPAGFGTVGSLLGNAYPAIIAIDQIQKVVDPFYADYAAAHDGRLPFVNPVPLSRWAYGRSLPPTAYDEAIANKTIYMNWWNTQITKPDSKTCSDSIILYPQSAAGPSYRNVYRSAPGVPTGFSVGRISVFAEVPDVVVPIAELPYNSTITGKEEKLPVTVSLMAAKGCDLMLFNLIADLQKAKIISSVKTGSTMY